MFFLSLLFTAAAAAPFTCTAQQTVGCFLDTPSGRAVNVLVATVTAPATSAASLDWCAVRCGLTGYPLAGVTGHATAPATFFCYCGADVTPGTPTAPSSSCDLPCPGNISQSCGANGFMALARIACSAPLPPAPVGPALPPGPACSQAVAKGWPFCDTTLSVDDRVADLVARISMAEAGALLTSRSSPAISRLGLPLFYWGSNAIHGIEDVPCVDGRCPTSFPQALALSATFNRTVYRAVGAVIGKELRAFLNINVSNIGLTSWAPTINIIRDPRWGRNQETISECPYVSGEYGAAFTLGLQNGTAGLPSSDRFWLSVSTLKHFAAYSLEQYTDNNETWTRQTFNALVSAFDLSDTYFPAFQNAIQTADARGVMYSCNEINGIPSDASVFLDDTLKSWGFKGYRTTDGGQIAQMVTAHHYVATIPEAIGVGLAAESDIDDGPSYEQFLIEALAENRVTIEQVQRSLATTFAIRFGLGLFQPITQQPFQDLGVSDINDDYAKALNLDAAHQALVLLQNRNDVLPFAAGRRVAVIGPHGNDTFTLQGSYGSQYCPSGQPGCVPTIYEAVAAFATTADFAPGCGINSVSAALLAAAVAAAQAADIVILVLGLDQSLESEQNDRYNITLPPAQQQLADAVLALGKPTATVLLHGGALALESLQQSCDAILDAHYPGVVGGVAIANALFGAYNPGGKLPYTVYPAVFQTLSNFTHMSMTEFPGRTYRYYTGPPALWPAFFGLSYTTFLLSFPTPPASPIVLSPLNATAVVSVEVQNTGALAGDEIVFAFFTLVSSSMPLPAFLPSRQLFSFERVHIASGAFTSVDITLQYNAFVVTANDGTRGVFPGRYLVTLSRGHGELLSVDVAISE